MVYNRKGENEKAETLFRDAIADAPENHELYYSLGLLLAEMGKYEESSEWLGKAAEFMPDRSRIFYNLGLIQEYLQRTNDAERALLRAYNLEPENQQFIYALVQFYQKQGNPEKARYYAELLED
jgi:Flp pilus assembly protein TadD